MRRREHGVSAEARLLTEAVREPRDLDTLQATAGAIADWARVATLARVHGVSAWLLDAHDAGMQLPPATAAQLRSDALELQARTMLLDADVAQTLPALDAVGVRTIVLKGPVLARTIYPQAALRPYGDVDLLVRAQDEDRAAEALASRGFSEVPFEAETARQAFHADDHYHAGEDDSGAFHRTFTGRGGRTLLELHVDPLQLGIATVHEQDRWMRAVPVPGLSGALMFALEDQLVHLAVHAHKHGFSRLIWLKDLDLIVRRHGDRIDWRLVKATARAEGVGASVWYALHLARLLLGTPAPRGIEVLAPSIVVRWMYERMWPRRRIMDLSGSMRRRAVQVHLAESWRGTLPSLVLMGRRGARARLVLGAALRRVRRRGSGR